MAACPVTENDGSPIVSYEQEFPMSRFLVALCLAATLMNSAPLQAEVKAPLTIVLVHGAFENSSIWDKVIPIIQHRGIKVVAVQNPAAGPIHHGAASAENHSRAE